MRFRRPRGGDSPDAEVIELRARVERLEQRVNEQEFTIRHTEDRVADAERGGDALEIIAAAVDRIAATTAVVAALPDAAELVSVVMPTRNRAHLLPRALASVQAQSHRAWELLVVDDGSTDETPAILADAAARDPRIRVLRTGGGGASTARNLALDNARGRYVAYLDDDNEMGPQWLRAIAWTFDRHPEAQIGYGARVIDMPAEGAPWIELRPWNRAQMQVRSIIDQNVLTHRAGLPELRYDVEIEVGSDWDAVMRATDDHDPVMIPVVAAIYGTASTDRLSDRPEAALHWAQVQRAALRRRPLRVLGVDLAAPPLSAAQTAAAIAGWEPMGAQTAWCVDGRPAAELAVPSFTRLGEAIREFGPAVVALYAASVTPAQLVQLDRANCAFVVIAPPEFELERLAAARAHPLCAGVWDAPGPSLETLLPALDLVRIRQLGLPDPAELLARADALASPGLLSAAPPR